MEPTRLPTADMCGCNETNVAAPERLYWYTDKHLRQYPSSAAASWHVMSPLHPTAVLSWVDRHGILQLPVAYTAVLL